MALFRQITVDEVTNKEYITREDVTDVITNVMTNSLYTVYTNAAPLSIDCVANQILAFQKCRGKEMHRRIFHFVLSFCNNSFEDFVDLDMASKIMNWMNITYFPTAQKILCLQKDADGNFNIHMVLNPMDLNTFNIIRYDIMGIIRNLAEYLGSFYKIKLQGSGYHYSRTY